MPAHLPIFLFSYLPIFCRGTESCALSSYSGTKFCAPTNSINIHKSCMSLRYMRAYTFLCRAQNPVPLQKTPPSYCVNVFSTSLNSSSVCTLMLFLNNFFKTSLSSMLLIISLVSSDTPCKLSSKASSNISRVVCKLPS